MGIVFFPMILRKYTHKKKDSANIQPSCCFLEHDKLSVSVLILTLLKHLQESMDLTDLLCTIHLTIVSKWGFKRDAQRVCHAERSLMSPLAGTKRASKD